MPPCSLHIRSCPMRSTPTRDLHTLVAFGLDRDQVDEVARLTIGAIEPDDVNTRSRRNEMEKTISRRWADLVDQWVP